jgi:hypothetical protein
MRFAVYNSTLRFGIGLGFDHFDPTLDVKVYGSRCWYILLEHCVLPSLTGSFTTGLALSAWYLHNKPIADYPLGQNVEKVCKLVS